MQTAEKSAPKGLKQQVWTIDAAHTRVEFSVKHLGMMIVRGHFTEVSANGTIDPGSPSPESVDLIINTASVRTNDPTRDNDPEQT